MGKQIQKLILSAVFALLATTVASAQSKQPADSLVRLMKASSVQMERDDSVTLRKTFDATFLHNGTYLICDTAVWNEITNIINASGHVKLIQGDAVLTSSALDYYVEENVAKFSGNLVEMTDKDKNILRTSSLDYYTKDSMARYDRGAVLKDHEGQIIESRNGTYDNTSRIFHFKSNVNMFTDSIFINTNDLMYDAKTDIAYFQSTTDFRKADNTLSATRGWYDRRKNLFFFEDDVHGMSPEQEVWGDSLYFYRDSQNIKLLGNAKVLDTVKKVAAIADYIYYEDSLSRVTMEKDPAVRMITVQNDVADTLYLRADRFEYQTIPYCEIDTLTVNNSKARLEGISSDPVMQYRIKVALEAKQKAEDAKKQQEEEKTGKKGRKKPDRTVNPVAPDDSEEKIETEGADSTMTVVDSLAVSDSTLFVTPDTTKIGFLTALRDIRLYKKDIQMCCDSVRYCDLDSIARIFGNPRIWNDGNRQYTADSIDLQILDSRPYKADLITGAFIIVEESKDLCYDQIKGSEVIAYFDTTSTLSRFDALGGASAIFYLKEKDEFATVNMVEAKMITAEFEQGEISKVTYFEKPKNNALPIVQMDEKEKYLTGFNYDISKRPNGKESITHREFPETQREKYMNHPSAKFGVSEKFFPGYIKGIRIEIANKRKLAAEEKKYHPSEEEGLIADSLEMLETVVDTLEARSEVAAEPALTYREMMDSVSVSAPVPAVQDTKVERQQNREKAKQLRLAKRQAKLEQKEEARRLKMEARKARREAKAASIAAKQQERELRILERYKERFRKKLLRSKEADDIENNL